MKVRLVQRNAGAKRIEFEPVFPFKGDEQLGTAMLYHIPLDGSWYWTGKQLELEVSKDTTFEQAVELSNQAQEQVINLLDELRALELNLLIIEEARR